MIFCKLFPYGRFNGDSIAAIKMQQHCVCGYQSNHKASFQRHYASSHHQQWTTQLQRECDICYTKRVYDYFYQCDQCKHAFCLSCLRQIIHTTRTRAVRCPFCRYSIM
jgi:hypothetical protein